MINVVLKEGNPPLPLWLDVLDPTREELNGLAENYRMHQALVHDCMDPFHLPKHETHEDTTFIIIRHYDDSCPLHLDSVQAMTRKIALFLGDRFLLSIHRVDQPFLEKIRAKHQKATGPIYLQVILVEILMAAVETFHKPLEEEEVRIHQFERAILQDSASIARWEDVFRTKCRLMVIKRMLWHSLNTVHKFVPFSDTNQPLRQDLRERIENLQFFADSLLDDLNGLLNIQMSLASNRTNESSKNTNDVMKVLTIFSAFFLPINFIVGVYGMNFVHMPELKLRYGYPAVWCAILATVGTIYLWFWKKRWVRLGHLS